MIKATTSTDKVEVGAASITVEEAELATLAAYFVFPTDSAARQHVKAIARLESRIANYEREIRSYNNVIRESKRSANAFQRELKSVRARQKTGGKVVGTDVAMKEIESLRRLPWVENISLRGGSIVVRTRPGMLKTEFTERFVNEPGKWIEHEFLDSPVTTELPQYEIALHMERAGVMPMSNERGTLAIQLVNARDVSEWVGQKTGFNYEPQAHWASNGTTGLGGWSKLCLGEYIDELEAAVRKGLLPFFTELAVFLQMSGDLHAYRSKLKWSLWLGKPEYNAFCLRKAEAGETQASLREKYKRDYKATRDRTSLSGDAGAESLLSMVNQAGDATIMLNPRGFTWRHMASAQMDTTAALLVDSPADSSIIEPLDLLPHDHDSSN